jgi:hypothetical protein
LLALVADMLALRYMSCWAAADCFDVDHITVWRWRHCGLALMPGKDPRALEDLLLHPHSTVAGCFCS